MGAEKNTTNDSKVQALYDCLQRRPRPEDVAELILEVLGPDLKPNERRELDMAARNSSKRSVWGYSSMAADFAPRFQNRESSQDRVAAFWGRVDDGFGLHGPEQGRGLRPEGLGDHLQGLRGE